MGKTTERGKRKIFLLHQTAACYVPNTKDLSTLGKNFASASQLCHCFSAASVIKNNKQTPKMQQQEKKWGAQEETGHHWHCCLLFASCFRAHVRDRVLKIPVCGRAAGLGWDWFSWASGVKEGMFCHVLLVRTEPSAGLLLHVGNTGVIIQFVLWLFKFLFYYDYFLLLFYFFRKR